MRSPLLILAILTGISHQAIAGRNANGTMAVHTNDNISYTSSANYCVSSLPPSCDEFVTVTTRLPEEEVAVIWLISAWLPGASPGVTAIQFGISHNLPDDTYFVRHSACGPSGLIELPDANWPWGSGETGNLIAYPNPVHSNPFAFYTFAIYGALGPDPHFATRTYPDMNEAKFVDDSQPPVEDLCLNFGVIRWGTPGYNQCPTPPPSGACCFSDGSCETHSQSGCEVQGGSYQGDDVLCDPDPCPQLGACCYPVGNCSMTLAVDCTGEWQGAGTSCDPNPCPQALGACCYLDGRCEYLLAVDCTGQWQGFGSNCDPNPCPPLLGACCSPDGTCAWTLVADCTEEWQGPGTICDPNPCPQPLGACCYPDGTCAMTLPWNCTGQWRGVGSSCDLDRCPRPGRNANGAMVVHTNNDINYTSSANYCSSSLPTTCDDFVTISTKPLESQRAVIWLIAAFLPDANPGVTAIQFGISHNLPSEEYISRSSACGPSGLLEYPDENWPGGAQETGNLIAYPTPVYSNLFPFYWFGVWGAPGDPHFGTRTHPFVGVANFVDDSTPPVQDICFNFGTIRWGEPGFNQCPAPLETGACCLPDGSCLILSQPECDSQGGDFRGLDIPCTPDPCENAPCQVTVLQPNGGEVLTAGDSYEIRWTFPGCGENAKIELLQDGVVGMTIATQTANDGLYLWTVESCNGENGYRIRITDIESGTIDTSDFTFSIIEEPAPCALRVLQPNGGEVWPANSIHRIAWQSETCGDLVKIELLIADPAFRVCQVIAESAPNTGSFDWTVGNCVSGLHRYKIRVSDPASGSDDTSDRAFAIPNAPIDGPTIKNSRLITSNPIRPSATIGFELVQAARVRITVFSVRGERIRDLTDGSYSAGHHQVIWDGRTDAGNEARSGVYYIRATLGDLEAERKVVLAR